MNTLVIIGCTKSKNKGIMKARDIYLKSNLFRLCMNYCDVFKYDFIIISAKYGVLMPYDVIEDYDITFNKKEQIKKMKPKIQEELKYILKNYDKIIVLTGNKYILTFNDLIDKRFEFPLKGLKIGKRISYLKNIKMKGGQKINE